MQVLVDDSLKKYIGNQVSVSKYISELGIKPGKLIIDTNFSVLYSADEPEFKIMLNNNNLVSVYRGNLDELDKVTLFNQYRYNSLAYPLKQYTLESVNEVSKRYDTEDIYRAHDETIIAILSYFDLIKKLTDKYVSEYRELSEYDNILSNYFEYIEYHLHSIFNMVENGILFNEEGVTESILKSLNLGNEYYYDLLNIVCGYYFDFSGDESRLERKATKLLTKAQL